MLYDRGYIELTEQETKEYNLRKERMSQKEGIEPEDILEFPEIFFRHESLFPNYMLPISELQINDRTRSILNEFTVILDNINSNERDILNFVKENKAYFIIASLFKYYRFGHHIAFAFPEFELPPNYRVDYLLVGKSSYGFEFVFVELEKPYKDITTSDGNLGTTFRKGLKQIEEWETWIESNFHHLRLLFEKYLGKHRTLTKEFLVLDTTRIHYVVVAGRRSDFNDTTYRIARKMKKNNNTQILHYDNLIDSALDILKNGNYV